MAPPQIPDDAPQIGSIDIALWLNEHGVGISYELDGVSQEAAIGYLTVVVDRLRRACQDDWEEQEEEEDAFG